MKKIAELLAQEPVFLNNWSAETEVFKDYEVEPNGFRVLFASYGSENYSGDAWALLEKDGILYEVGGSHCSCHGLEGQWEPDTVLLEELFNRLTKGSFGRDDWSGNTFAPELEKFLGIDNKSEDANKQSD